MQMISLAPLEQGPKRGHQITGARVRYACGHAGSVRAVLRVIHAICQRRCSFWELCVIEIVGAKATAITSGSWRL